LDKIVSQMSSEKEKQWVADRLYHTTIPNLQNRIVETVDALSLRFAKERLIKFAQDCAKRRNDLAHGGHQDRAIAYSDFISSVQKLNNALSHLYHALLLVEIGLDPEVVRTWVLDSPPPRFGEGGRSRRLDLSTI
jgi:hypothetical protein